MTLQQVDGERVVDIHYHKGEQISTQCVNGSGCKQLTAATVQCGGCCRVSIEGAPLPRRGHREAANLYRPFREATDHFPDGVPGAEVPRSDSETTNIRCQQRAERSQQSRTRQSSSSSSSDSDDR